MQRFISGKGSTSNFRLDRTFEVRFTPREPKSLLLDNSENLMMFKAFLTDASLALTVRKAECFMPDERLHHLKFMDTAGLCSPVGFHADVTAELLERRPDKIIVLLDSRRIESPTNLVALNVL